jgi:hypothetical protein
MLLYTKILRISNSSPVSTATRITLPITDDTNLPYFTLCSVMLDGAQPEDRLRRSVLAYSDIRQRPLSRVRAFSRE